MTDISVQSVAYQAEDRSWLITQPGGVGDGFTRGCTLDVSAFNAAQYPNGFLPSGTALGIITATSTGNAVVVGPYDDTAGDGRQVLAGILFSSVKIPNLADLTKDVGAAMLTAFAVVRIAKLPFTTGQAGRGYVDANGQADLKNVHFI